MPPQDNEMHSEPGRRSYDLEIAELRFEMKAMREENKDLREDVRDMKNELKHLVEAWNTAKGMNQAIKWLMGMVIALGASLAVLKGWISR